MDFLNPDVVRTKFVAIGLYMVGHEMLLDALRDRPRDFFATDWTPDGVSLPSSDYETEVLALDPKGKANALRGAVAWLLDLEAIDDADVSSLREFTDARNTIAHELHKVVGGHATLELAGLFPRLVALLTKVERWWVINVELATNPDFDGVEIDEEGVVPGSVVVMQMLCRVALGAEEEAWTFHRIMSGEQ